MFLLIRTLILRHFLSWWVPVDNPKSKSDLDLDLGFRLGLRLKVCQQNDGLQKFKIDKTGFDFEQLLAINSCGGSVGILRLQD